jgi:pectate lyase
LILKSLIAVFILAAAPALARAAAPSTQKAFPTAEGFGRYAQGGRGGAVLFVDNLNDSGPGSFRAAVEAKGPRTVIFRVAGTIQLKTKLVVREPFITIAGQTAPGDGICLANYEFYVATHDAIVRYLRCRPGNGEPGERDALTVRDAENVIVDHCSASWAVDEVLSTTKSKNVTVQWCVISEALHDAGHHKGNHGYGGLIQCEGATYHHNLYAHNRSRNPRPGSGLIDFRNNVIYDWNGMAGYAEGNTHRLNYIANYLKAGPSTQSGPTIAFHTGKEKTFIHFDGNVLEGVVAPGEDDAKIINVRNGGNVSPTPHDVPPVKTESAIEARDRVFKEAGAILPKRDAVDARVVSQVRQGTGHQINTANDVGSWPELTSTSSSADADQDGMPDAWETAATLNSNNHADGNADADGDGYTNLEEFLNATDAHKVD